MATREGTWGYRERFGDRFGRTYFRRFGPGVVSSVGLGTYLGDPTDAVDDAYREAIVAAVENGINAVDTAVNYRHGRSERVVGEALADADVDRSAVVVATKGGFVPFDGERPADPAAYVRETFVEDGPLDPADLARGSHAVAPAFLDALLDRSLDRLGLDAVDCYYVHNPETQLAVRSRAATYDALEAAFEALERRVAAGDVAVYGVATWEAFRVPPEHDAYLSLDEVCRRAARAARHVGADESHLGAIQLPFNVRMADAFTCRAHPAPDGSDGSDDAGGPGASGATEGSDGSARGEAVDPTAGGTDLVSALEYARRAGLDVFASASIGQGDLADAANVPGEVAARLAGDTSAQRAINFARSGPGITCALVGASDADHVAENAAAGTFDPLGARAFDAVFE